MQELEIIQSKREALLAKELYKRKLAVNKERREAAKKEDESRKVRTKTKTVAKRGNKKRNKAKKAASRKHTNVEHSDQEVDQALDGSHDVAGHLRSALEDSEERDGESADGLSDCDWDENSVKTRSQLKRKKAAKKSSTEQSSSTAVSGTSSGRKRKRTGS